MHSFHSVPICFGLGVGEPGKVEYQLYLGDGFWFTLCVHDSLRSAVGYARYDEVNFEKRKCTTRILVPLPVAV